MKSIYHLMFSDIRCFAIFSPCQSVYSRKQHGLTTLRLEQGSVAQTRFSATVGGFCALCRHQWPLFNVTVGVSTSLHRQRLTTQQYNDWHTVRTWSVLATCNFTIHRKSSLLLSLRSAWVLTICCYKWLTGCPKESGLLLVYWWATKALEVIPPHREGEELWRCSPDGPEKPRPQE